MRIVLVTIVACAVVFWGCNSLKMVPEVVVSENEFERFYEMSGKEGFRDPSYEFLGMRNGYWVIAEYRLGHRSVAQVSQYLVIPVGDVQGADRYRR